MPLLVPLAFLAFIALGLPDGILGVAWPSMRRDFAVPLDTLGLLLGTAVVGYFASSFSCGKLLALLGLGNLLAFSTWLTGVSLLGYALLPAFPLLLAAACLAGLGGGAVDSALNTYAAFRFRPRTLNWLHASYSLGAFLGPTTVALALAAGLTWRWAYGAVALVQAALGIIFFVARNRWDLPHADAPGADSAAGSGAASAVSGGAGSGVADAGPAPDAAGAASTVSAGAAAPSYRETLALGPVWGAVLAFFLYTGLEVSVGQWSYTLLREGRGLEAGRAAFWVSLFWGGFTGGRVIAGLLPLADRTAWVLRLCSAGMLAGAALAALGHDRWPTPLGLLLVGLSFAPIYPALVSSTPARLGRRHAANAMGFQVAAATAGMAAVPALIGVAARRLGHEAIARGWVLCAVAALAVLVVLAGGARRGTMSGNG